MAHPPHRVRNSAHPRPASTWRAATPPTKSLQRLQSDVELLATARRRDLLLSFAHPQYADDMFETMAEVIAFEKLCADGAAMAAAAKSRLLSVWAEVIATPATNRNAASAASKGARHG